MTFKIAETFQELQAKYELEGSTTVTVKVTEVNGLRVRDLWALEIEIDDALRSDDGIMADADGCTYLVDVEDVPRSYERDPQVILVTVR